MPNADPAAGVGVENAPKAPPVEGVLVVPVVAGAPKALPEPNALCPKAPPVEAGFPNVL